MCAALALYVLFVGAGAPLAQAAQSTPSVSYDYDMRSLRNTLIRQYLYQFGYPQSANSVSSSCLGAPSLGNPLLQNLRTLMVLYNLYRNNNDGLLSPSRANVGDLMVLYMLFCTTGSAL